MTTRSGWCRRAMRDGLRDRAGLGHDLELLAPVEQRDQALADDLVVVDDQQPQRPPHRYPSACRGPICRVSLGIVAVGRSSVMRRLLLAAARSG